MGGHFRNYHLLARQQEIQDLSSGTSLLSLEVICTESLVSLRLSQTRQWPAIRPVASPEEERISGNRSLEVYVR